MSQKQPWRIIGIPADLLDVQDDPSPVDLGSIEADSAESAIAAFGARVLAEFEDDPDGEPPPMITGAVAFSAADLAEIAARNADAVIQRAAMAGCAARGISYCSGKPIGDPGGDGGWVDKED